MNESTLKLGLVEEFKKLRSVVLFRHEDVFRAGVPDISVTCHHMTTWLEVKYDCARRRMESREIQNLTCRQLAKVGSCYYVVYEDFEEKRTCIVHPDNFSRGRIVDRDAIPDECSDLGFSHLLVTEFIRKLHHGHNHRSE